VHVSSIDSSLLFLVVLTHCVASSLSPVLHFGALQQLLMH
jgi:hypothetical protein